MYISKERYKLVHLSMLRLLNAHPYFNQIAKSAHGLRPPALSALIFESMAPRLSARSNQATSLSDLQEAFQLIPLPSVE